MSRKRGLLIGVGMGIVCALCFIGVVSMRLLVSIFPVSLFPPRLGTEQPLGQGEAIAFSYMRVDMLRPFQVYILDDANGIRSISQGLMRSDIGPVWSPDGTLIAYKSVSGNGARYYLVDVEGVSRREITRDDSPKELLRWAPDGSRLAYVTYDRHSDGSISDSPYLCVTEIITGDTHQIPAENVQDLVWMPDGHSLLMIVRTDEQVAIDLYDPNSKQQQRMSAADYLRDAAYMSLSPDASKVAYITPIPDDGIQSVADSLNVSALDGSATKSIDILWIEGSLIWSPDSTRIAFVALANDFQYALYVVDTDSMEPHELMLINTGDESGEIAPAAPAWSPDGTRIAISSISGPKGAAVFVMNADGTERRQITAYAGFGGMIYDLAWQPGE